MVGVIALVRYVWLGYQIFWGFGLGLVVALIIWQMITRLWERPWSWLVPCLVAFVIAPAIVGAIADQAFQIRSSIEFLQR